MPPLPVADQLSGGCEGRGALAGAEGSNQKSCVVLVKECCGALLVGTQDAREEGGVHRSAAFALV